MNSEQICEKHEADCINRIVLDLKHFLSMQSPKIPSDKTLNEFAIICNNSSLLLGQSIDDFMFSIKKALGYRESIIPLSEALESLNE
ncbi:MAG: hypothetical protein JRJ62_04715 [Deltaproteobacteria bacterium]|nr:hypothetical protein [Deltaproteobacteria bacterium]